MLTTWCRNQRSVAREISSYLNNNTRRKRRIPCTDGCFGVKRFSLGYACMNREGATKKVERLKATTKALNELNESYIDLLRTTKASTQNAHDAKQFWRTGYKSRLIKLGVAIVMIREPTPISPTVGASFIEAGAVQKAIRNRSLFVEDVNKTFKNTMKDIAALKQNI